MKIIALGGGAGKILARILHTWPDPPATLATNTDAAALHALHVPEKYLIGQGVARGLGCGGDPRLGQIAAGEDPDALRTMVADADLLILLASCGGGFATGAAPAFAHAARAAGALTLAFVTTPFAIEGPQRMAAAKSGITRLREAADAVVVLPNEHLRSLLPHGATLEESFAATDRMVAAALRGLWTLLSRDNTLNYDFSDLQSLVENANNECAFGYGQGTGPNRVEDALRALLEGPGLDHSSTLANAGAMLINVIGGRDLSIDELNRIRNRITDVARQGAQIAIGVALLDDFAGRLAITILAAEHWTPPPPPKLSSASPPPRGKKRSADGQTRLFGPDGATPLPHDPPPFTGLAPTLQNGADLDTPTYIRRNIHIRS